MISWNFLAFLAGSVIEFHNHDAYRILTKDFQAFRVGLLRRVTSAEFAFLFMVSNPFQNRNFNFFLKNHHLPKFY